MNHSSSLSSPLGLSRRLKAKCLIAASAVGWSTPTKESSPLAAPSNKGSKLFLGVSSKRFWCLSCSSDTTRTNTHCHLHLKWKAHQTLQHKQNNYFHVCRLKVRSIIESSNQSRFSLIVSTTARHCCFPTKLNLANDKDAVWPIWGESGAHPRDIASINTPGESLDKKRGSIRED